MAQKIQQNHDEAFALFEWISNAWASRMLELAAEWGIADLLKDGPKSITELAEATQTHEPSLRRMMRALVAVGLFTETDADVYGLNNVSKYLCDGVPGSLRNFTIFFGRDWAWNLWNALPYSIKTGESGMNNVHKKNFWQFLDENAYDAELFNKGMAEFSALVNPSIADAYDFSEFKTIVDVGGGYGNFLVELFDRYPSLHGTLLERDSVIEEAKEFYAQTPYTSRCTFVAGDFFVEVPAGADAYLLKFITNDWDDERARQILTVCRRAIPEHGKLLIAELVLASQNPVPAAALMDVSTFLSFDGGHGRTDREFEKLLGETGFKYNRIVPAASGLYIIEGSPC